jgi:hypothetical protein
VRDYSLKRQKQFEVESVRSKSGLHAWKMTFCGKNRGENCAGE